ncbi:MAG: ABC transporter permease [Acidobacteria bacterium]|nr:ABC transporter permease [Acidobacteriota bacterium]
MAPEVREPALRAGGAPDGHRARAGAAAWIVGGLAIVALLAPVIANERPLLARVDGRLIAPAFADLPILGPLFDAPVVRSIPWYQKETGRAIVLLRPPVPYSYRGILLDDALLPPGRRHLLGTDALGRDLLARLIHGTRPSLLIGFVATAVSLLLGLFLGALAAMRGGAADLLIVRLVDVVACFPPFVLALAFVAASGHGGLWPVAAGIALNRWTGMARYVRGEILRHRRGDLWASARATGASAPRLVVRHLLPLLAGPLAVMASFGVAHAIVLESSLSFVGFGVEPPAPSWGTILAESRATLDAAWWPVVFPSLGLLVTLGALCLAAERVGGAGRGRQEPLF